MGEAQNYCTEEKYPPFTIEALMICIWTSRHGIYSTCEGLRRGHGFKIVQCLGFPILILHA